MKKILTLLVPTLIVGSILIGSIQRINAIPIEPTTPPPCSPEYLMTLHHSNIYKESDWDMMFAQMDFEDATSWNDNDSQALKLNEFVDLNGDRRDDFVRLYAKHDYSEIDGMSSEFKACVQLNTGKGFKIAHNCYAKIAGTDDEIVTQDYYGDCAL